jgi:hypothetical protein
MAALEKPRLWETGLEPVETGSSIISLMKLVRDPGVGLREKLDGMHLDGDRLRRAWKQLGVD